MTLKNSKIFVLITVFLLLLVACIQDSTPVGSEREEGEKVLKVAHLVNGYLGDKSFHDSAERGLKNTKEALKDAFEYRSVEMTDDESKFEPTIMEFAESGEWDIIVVGTWQMEELLMQVAEAFPDQKFMIYDEDIDYSLGDYDNIYSFKFKQNEASFLAGYLASKMSVLEGDEKIDPTKPMIGFVGGMETPIINDFLLGYVQGAKTANPETEVAISFTGDFFDTAKAKDLALAEYQSGVDICYNPASLAGLGVIDAAVEANKYVIGVDSDQAELMGEPKSLHILTSVMKNVDVILQKAIMEHRDNTLAYGTTEEFGLTEGGVGLAKNSMYERLVPEDIRNEVDEIEAKIKGGEITVHTALGKTQEEVQKILRDE